MYPKGLDRYQVLPHPMDARLAVLQLEANSEQHWYLMDLKVLQSLAEALTEHAEKYKRDP